MGPFSCAQFVGSEAHHFMTTHYSPSSPKYMTTCDNMNTLIDKLYLKQWAIQLAASCRVGP